MDRNTRNAIQRATQAARTLLEEEVRHQLEGTYDILLSGEVAEQPGSHLSAEQAMTRDKLVAAVARKRASGMNLGAAVKEYRRDAAFTTLNRFVALKMLEARGLVQQCVSNGEDSSGFKEFAALSPGLLLLPDKGYPLYLESVFDEIATEVRVLFDRRDAASLLWPRRQALLDLVELLDADELSGVWDQDETIGWVYQYFNSEDERREMRKSQAPRNGRELAVRNQFFTPRYVVDFLVHNTLGELWCDMTEGRSELSELALRVPRSAAASRQRKDPREIRVLDPACGSGHFLLASFDLLTVIYREAWSDDVSTKDTAGKRLRDEYTTEDELTVAVPRLIVENNLYGIDIDTRCTQIAALALWMRAQRAWNELGIAREDRPRVRKSNLVVAEPIPVAEDARREFLAELDPELAELARSLFERLELAGEAGSLLELQDWLRSEVRERFGDSGALFAEEDETKWKAAESRLLSRLREFAQRAHEQNQWAQTLFAEDAVRGLAFIDTVQREYDVVLMNPPFGDPTSRSKKVCGEELGRSANDLGGAFVLAAKRRWAPSGCIGVLSSTTLWFKPTAAEWRRETMLAEGHGVRVAAHLGGGVLDGATVSASATVIDLMSSAEDALFVRLLFDDKKPAGMAESIISIRSDRVDDRVFRVAPNEFARFRGAPLAYWISKALRLRLSSFPALEGNGAVVRQGVETPADFRFVAAWWEVAREGIGLNRKWAPFAKSSTYSPLWDDITWVVRWEDGGREVWASERSANAPRARHPRGGPSTAFFGRAGVTYPARSVLGFNPRAFPANSAFGHMGAVAFPTEVGASALLAYLASRPLEYILSFSNGALQGKKGAYPNHYEVGQIKDLPWPPWSAGTVVRLDRFGDELATAAMQLQANDETTHQYAGHPGLSDWKTVRAAVEDPIRRRAKLVANIRTVREKLDEVVAEELGFDESDITEMNREFARCEQPASGPWSPSFGELSPDALREGAEDIASELFGFAIGRVDIRPALGDHELPIRDSAFEPLPPGTRALLDGTPDDYPIPVPTDHLLVVDTGSDWDVGRAIDRVAVALWGDRSKQMEDELATLLGFDDLRSYFGSRSKGGFFARHIKRYSKSRRTAPVYWSLTTASGQYAAFLHYASLRRDTIFALLHNQVEPALAHERRAFEALKQSSGQTPAAAQRAELADRQSRVDELSAFVHELKLVAPLWSPRRDDGVAINASMLWRVMPQVKAWQKKLTSTWAALCAGEYDGAHLAMHLWPERVLPKCAEARRLAVAHGLEDVFWLEDDTGEWHQRQVDSKTIAALLKERDSPMVKTALQSLLAPAAATKGKRGRSKRK